MPNQAQVEREIKMRLLAAWQAKAALATKNPWLAAYLLRQGNRIREQLSQLYKQLLALLSLVCSRRGWRRFKEALPSLIIGGALLLAMNLGVSPARAANIPVTTTNDTIDANAGVCGGMTIAQLPGPDGETSLREAICAANTNAGVVDTLDLTTITGTITLGSDLPSITDSVQLNGPGAANLTLDGGGNQALYGPAAGTNIGVDGLTITNVSGDGVYAYNNATVTNSTVTGNDDGVQAFQGDATVTNSTITGNGGNGIEAGNNAIVIDSIVTGDDDGVEAGNEAIVTNSTVTGYYDDGVDASNNATVADSTVTGYEYGVYARTGNATVTNSTVTGYSYDGVFAGTDATVTNNSIVTGYYDGVFARTGDVTVADSTVTGYYDDGVDAGNNAIVTNSIVTGYYDGIFTYQGDATVSGSTVTGYYLDGVAAYNNAIVTNSIVTGYYNGIHTFTGGVTVTDSTITGYYGTGIDALNDATVTDSTVTGYYYGVMAFQGDATVTGSTVTGNTDDGVAAYNNAMVANSTISGSGRYGIYSYNAGTVRVTNSTLTGSGSFGINNAGPNYVNNSIIAGNNGGGPDLNGPFNNATSQSNLVGNGDGAGLTNGVNGNQVGTAGSLIDPQLGPLANNGGSTQTHALLPGSPAIDTADNGTCAAAPINNRDQRGVARPTDGDGNGTATCDIGAYEAPAVAPPTGSGGDKDDDDEAVPTPTPVPLSDQVFDCWPWEIIVPPLVVPNAGTICQPSLGTPLPIPSTLRYLGHSTDVVIKDAAGMPVTQFNPSLKICFRYTQTELDAVGGKASDFLIQTLRNGNWESLPTNPASDPSPTVLGRVCAPVDHLTLFALFVQDGQTAPAEANNPLAPVKYLPETGVQPVSLWGLRLNGALVTIGGAVFVVTMIAGMWLIWRKQN